MITIAFKKFFFPGKNYLLNLFTPSFSSLIFEELEISKELSII